jgi:hypothetical protein
VGSVLEAQHGPWGLGTASFDTSRRYRYRLSRLWDPRGPRVCFVMLNPSTADASRLDPTVRRCVGFARSWGAGAVEVINLFALCSRDPTVLREVEDPTGVSNDDALRAAARDADQIVCAWGVHGELHDRGRIVLELVAEAGAPLVHLGLTRAGHPKHPLYLRGDAERVPLSRKASS